MTHFTPSVPLTSFSSKTKMAVRKMADMKPVLHASADALFFVQLFARACNTQAMMVS